MPKKLYKVSEFHGGLDETSSPVDLPKGFLPVLTDVVVDKVGQIVPMGDFDNAPTHNPTNTNFIVHSGNPGFGLFAFASNRRLTGAQSDCVIYVVPKYISGDEGENFIFWDSTGNSWADFADSGNNGDLSGHALDLRAADLAGQFEADYFVSDKVLRICDGNMANITDLNAVAFAHKSKRGWLGYILRTHFPNANPGGSADAYADWYGYNTVQPEAPTRGYISSLASATAASGTTTTIVLTNSARGLATEMGADYSRGYIVMQDNGTAAGGHTVKRTDNDGFTFTIAAGTASGQAFKIFPGAGLGCVLDIAASDTGGSMPESNYTFGSTFVYDGHQESPIFDLTNGFGTTNDSNADAWASNLTGYGIGAGDTGKFSGSIHLTAPYPARISGMRIYYQFDQDINDQWYLAWDIDFAQGSRVSLSNSTFQEDTAGTPFTLDTLHGSSSVETVIHTLPDLVLPGESYFTINGYYPKEDIDIRYKTSAIVSNFLFVGNVYKKVGGVASHYPDRIWRCAFPTYAGMAAVDVFPEVDYYTNPGTNGDPITKLVSLGNQLLVFGSTYLTVFNVAGGVAISGTFTGYGVDQPCQVAKTPKGIAFANHNGVFIYNGQDVIDLLSAAGQKKKVVDWAAFWTTSNIPSIGYDALNDVLVILKGTDHSADPSKDIVVYDFTTGSWTKGDTKFSASLDISNMITAPDTGELVALHQSNSAASNLKRFKMHQVANISSSTVNITTPFYDFGSSGNKKRLYKVRVLCQGENLDDLDIVASYDGNSGTYSDIFSGTGNTFANTTADDWDAQTFTVTSPTDFNNVSIKIYATGAMTTADWGISEITFIYREKGIR